MNYKQTFDHFDHIIQGCTSQQVHGRRVNDNTGSLRIDPHHIFVFFIDAIFSIVQAMKFKLIGKSRTSGDSKVNLIKIIALFGRESLHLLPAGIRDNKKVVS